MLDQSDAQPVEWESFLQSIQFTTEIDINKVVQYVKVKSKEFPSDNQMTQYYEQVFTKTTNQINRKKWHCQDKLLLIWCVAKLLQTQGRSDFKPTDEDWDKISRILNIPKLLLITKWISLLHSNLKIAQWSKEEDKILLNISKQCYKKNNWTELTLKFNSLSKTQRYPKQIRERWNNVLNPEISKTIWTKEEKLKLLKLVLENGKRWAKIQTQLEGRSENQIKNQYNAITKVLKRFNATFNDEKNLIKLIVNNPDVKISNHITKFVFESLSLNQKQKYEVNIEQNESHQPQQFEKLQQQFEPTEQKLQIFNNQTIYQEQFITQNIQQQQQKLTEDTYQQQQQNYWNQNMLQVPQNYLYYPQQFCLPNYSYQYQNLYQNSYNYNQVYRFQ